MHYSFADPSFSGITPLPQTVQMPSHDIIVSRRKYFQEGDEVGNIFMNRYIQSIRQMYEDRREWQGIRRNGFLFMIATCLLDWFVCIK
jgi:hypothetical protein